MAIVRTLALNLGQMEDHWKGLSRRLTLAPRLRVFDSRARVEAGKQIKRLQKFGGRCLRLTHSGTGQMVRRGQILENVKIQPVRFSRKLDMEGMRKRKSQG